MPTKSQIEIPQELNMSARDLATEWKRFHSQWISYVKEEEIAQEEDDYLAAVLLAFIGTEAFCVFQSMPLTDAQRESTVSLLDAFARHCSVDVTEEKNARPHHPEEMSAPHRGHPPRMRPEDRHRRPWDRRNDDYRRHDARERQDQRQNQRQDNSSKDDCRVRDIMIDGRCMKFQVIEENICTDGKAAEETLDLAMTDRTSLESIDSIDEIRELIKDEDDDEIADEKEDEEDDDLANAKFEGIFGLFENEAESFELEDDCEIFMAIPVQREQRNTCSNEQRGIYPKDLITAIPLVRTVDPEGARREDNEEMVRMQSPPRQPTEIEFLESAETELKANTASPPPLPSIGDFKHDMKSAEEFLNDRDVLISKGSLPNTLTPV